MTFRCSAVIGRALQHVGGETFRQGLRCCCFAIQGYNVVYTSHTVVFLKQASKSTGDVSLRCAFSLKLGCWQRLSPHAELHAN